MNPIEKLPEVFEHLSEEVPVQNNWLVWSLCFGVNS